LEKNSATGSSPAQLRQIFGTNLRKLCQSRRSVSAVSRDLGINRTQFNRYLSGESFPRLDVLYLICKYFSTDARILLEQHNAQLNDECTLLTHSEIKAFYTPDPTCVERSVLSSGLYRFARPSFADSTIFIQVLSLVYRVKQPTFIRGLKATGSTPRVARGKHRQAREWRGFLIRQDCGISGLISGKDSGVQSYMFLTPQLNEQPNFWLGYCTQSTAESVTGPRVTRLTYEYLGQNLSKIMQTARTAGRCTANQLPQQHRKLLMPLQTFY
jgi:transcriptional regulator with XRE-family HTH domain